MSDSNTFDALYDVAIIGMAGRFPGAHNVEQFWQNLKEGIESIAFFTDQELSALGVDEAILSDPNYVKAGGVLEGAEWFDANFFGFTPNEAAATDPQQRIFLECAAQALETAGYAPSTYAGRIGVYAGVSQNGYLLSLFSAAIPQPLSNFQLMLGNDKDYLATRASYKLNLRGPAVTVQTACSTSLVAIHLAYQSLLNHECDMALAGGASIILPQNAGYLYQEGGLFSPDGHVRAFDAQGRGLVNGNGVCLVVLKRLAEALTDRDCVYAVIKGSAMNNDGSNKVGYTAPGVSGQAAVIAEALAAARVDPDTITYIETHGTGTPLGDPVEISALTQAFRAHTQKKNFCAIGSVKTNIGHLSSAAGAASVIKTTLALHHHQIPPSLHFQQPNPRIDFANSPFYVNIQLRDWATNGSLRRAGVSSFGLGGTNVHMILEQAPEPAPSGPARSWQLLVLSAKTGTALETAASNLAEHLRQHPELNLADVAYTLQVGRDAFSHRLMLVCRDHDDAVAALETLDPARVIRAVQEFNDRPVVFMFPGGGAQYVNMGRELYETEPTFRAEIDRGAEYLQPRLNLDLRDWMYPAADQEEEAAQQLERTRLGLPALFMTEYALAKLWIEWGIRPQAMIGHSLGEYVAACLAGVFSFKEALDLVALRGELFERLPEGAMLSVPLSEADMQPLLGQDLSLAAVNGAALCVASGPVEAIAALQETLAARGVSARRVHISVAAHSEMVSPILGEFLRFVEKLRLQPPQIPYLSNVTGTWVTASEATDPNYWARHLRQTVRFAQGIEELLQEPGWVLLEVGPGQTLTRLIQMRPERESDQVILSSMRHPEDKQSDVTCLLNRLGQLWLAGQSVDWAGFAHGFADRGHIPLPTYPFERQRYWIEPLKQSAIRASHDHTSLSKKPNVSDWCYLPIWKQTPLVQRMENVKRSEAHERWLLFVDTCGLGAQIAQQLEQAGHSVVTVVTGDGFARLSENVYALNPRERGDYAELISDLQASSRLPQKLIHLWSVASDEPSVASRARLAHCHELGYYSVLFLVQALGEAQSGEACELVIVSSNMQPVTGLEALCPEKATLLGMSKVISQEYPHMTCRSVDVDGSVINEGQSKQLAARLCAELIVECSEPIVAYRGNRRWVPDFESIRLDDQSTPRLRKRGVYLINGGLGDVGFVMAEYLAKTMQARLAVVGRTPLPPRGEWDKWLLAHDAQDRISTKISKVRALEALGAEVLALTADVTDLEQMRDAVVQTQAHFGALNGVIHSAIEGKLINLIQGTTRAECERNFAPKVDALFVLEEAVRDLPLDFCLLQSSIASILGGVGYVVYAASNTFTDAFAWYHTQTASVPWLSINWDIWKVGDFQAHVEQSPNLGKALRPFAMTVEEGLEAFRRSLCLDATQVIISTGSLSDRMEQWLAAKEIKESERTSKGSKATLHPRPHLRNEYIAPRNELEETMAAIWQKQLGIEQVGVHDNFFELGGDSLLAVQFIPLISRTFQVDVNVQKLLETPTVAGTASAVTEALQTKAAQREAQVAQLLDELERLSDDEVQELLAKEQGQSMKRP